MKVQPKPIERPQNMIGNKAHKMSYMKLYFGKKHSQVLKK